MRASRIVVRSLALHEAAHAVVAHIFGAHVYRLRIDRAALDADANDAPLESLPPRLGECAYTGRDHACILLAAVAAQSLFDGTHRFALTTDEPPVLDPRFIDLYFEEEERNSTSDYGQLVPLYSQAEIATFYSRALEIVKRNWPAIAALSDALVASPTGELDEAALDVLLGRACSAA
jgi:hypothetical protein